MTVNVPHTILTHGREERTAEGRAAREVVPLGTHAEFTANELRDPIGRLLGQARTRVPELVPIRHGRMLASAFAYYRGAALPMAADLAGTPASGIRVQLCGDAHLSNFGMFGSPERRLVFDINDFDETLPGPFEWDVKRLAASLVVAAGENGFSAADARKAALAAAKAYRTAMRDFAGDTMLAVWYAHLDVEMALTEIKAKVKQVKATKKMLAKARARDNTQALGKLTAVVGGHRTIVSDPPTVVPLEEIFTAEQAKAVRSDQSAVLEQYRGSLRSDRRHLLDQYHLTQVARKVVGVGSVGTRSWILLMEAVDGGEPLLLQAKEAQPSVLAEYCGGGRYENEGERVVAGQHLMQAASDIFLGWSRVEGVTETSHDYYLRQLRDWKFAVPVESLAPSGMKIYARLCGWTLARAHARSGDRIAIASYLGGSPRFEEAIADFAETYAEQNQRDYLAFQHAVEEGTVEAATDV